MACWWRLGQEAIAKAPGEETTFAFVIDDMSFFASAHALCDGEPGPMGRLTKVPEGIPPYLVLSVLGGTGMTAYFGMLEVGEVKEGDTVLVSGAAG